MPGEVVSNMTRIQEIKAREQAATPGEWQASGAKNDILTMNLDIIACFCDREDDYGADCDFIAHARSDVPWLLEKLKAAREYASEMDRDDCVIELLRILEGSD